MEISILGKKMRLEIIILCMLIGSFITCNVFFTCAGGITEGFAILDNTINCAYSGNVFASLDKNSVDDSEPLPEGQMSIFAQNTLSPSCCPATYSGSTGCVCATPEQMRFISARGGNNAKGSNV